MREASIAVDSEVLTLAYPASEDRATVSANLRTNVREIFRPDFVTNSQVLPVREQRNFDYIGVKLTVTGDLPALDRALARYRRLYAPDTG